MVLRSRWKTKITEKKSLWIPLPHTQSTVRLLSHNKEFFCDVLLRLHIHNLLESNILSPSPGKGQPFLHPHPPKSPVKPVAQGITKLLLILWGEPHRNKKTLGSGNPLTPRRGPGGERLPEGKEAQKGPAADSGQRECHRCWDL